MRQAHSGRLLLRLDPRLHRKMAERAAARRTSINRLCAQLIEAGLDQPEGEAWWLEEGKRISEALGRRFGSKLVGVIAFGSQLQGTATDASDVDLLIVLDSSVPIQRALYRWWDEAAVHSGPVEFSPQFVHPPKDAEDAGGLWLEAAMGCQVILQRGRALTRIIEDIKAEIAGDRFRRYWSNGQPYWVRREDEEQGSGS